MLRTNVFKQGVNYTLNDEGGSNSRNSGDLATAEFEINETPLAARDLLTKGYVQEEINEYSGASVSTRGRYLSQDEKAFNPGQRPLYLHIQGPTRQSIDLAIQRIREIVKEFQNQMDIMPNLGRPSKFKAGPNQQQQNMSPQNMTQQNMNHQNIPQHIMPPQNMPQQNIPPQNMPPQNIPPQNIPQQNMPQQNMPPQNIPQQNMPLQNMPIQNMPQQNMPPQNMPPPLMSLQTTMPSVEKVIVGLEHAPPNFDLRNKLIGQGGANLHYIRNETGAIVTLRGKGSGFIEPNTGQESAEPLHLFCEHPKFESLQAARQLSYNLVETMQQEFAQFQHQQQQQQAHQQQQHNQQQQQINNMTLHPGHLQAVNIGQPGLVTLQAQPQELVQQSGLVATSISLPVVSNVSGVFTSHMPQGVEKALCK